MDLKKQFQELCKVYGIKPARSRGQNFLINEDIYSRIVAEAELNKEDNVLEVGPGLGFLTIKLSQKAGRVVAVELEEKMAEVLFMGLEARGADNAEVVNRNILQIDPIKEYGYKAGGYKIVANLPYSITSAFLRKYLDPRISPSVMVLLLQKEVAERIAARAGQMSLLAVSVQFFAQPEIVESISKENFWPQPEVDSAIVKIRKRIEPEVNERGFFRLVKIGFSSRRRMLKNNLAAGYYITEKKAREILIKAGFNEKVRAQELSVRNWEDLLSYVSQRTDIE